MLFGGMMQHGAGHAYSAFVDSGWSSYWVTLGKMGTLISLGCLFAVLLYLRFSKPKIPVKQKNRWDEAFKGDA